MTDKEAIDVLLREIERLKKENSELRQQLVYVMKELMSTLLN